MPTANERLMDLAVRHQVDLQRYTRGEIGRIHALLQKADQQLAQELRAKLTEFGVDKPVDFQGQRLKDLLDDVRGFRQAAMTELKQTSRNQLFKLAKVEADTELSIIHQAIPFEVDLAAVTTEQVRKIVTSKPFQGKLLREWFNSLDRADGQRLAQEIRLGLVEGDSIPNMVRRVVGSRANNYADGVLSITRRNAEAVVRTATNHVSNAAREATWQANSDVMELVRWTSTLDGRTTIVCQGRDGAVARLDGGPVPDEYDALEPPGARPPAHIGCRSGMVGVIHGKKLLGERPTVRDTRTPRQREIDFRAQAKQQAGTNWKAMTPKQRTAAIRGVRDKWAAENIGQVPAKTTYQQWLSKQPAGFQEDVLGKAKAKLFREGKMPLDKFVDRRGKPLTLAELAKRDPGAFDKAGLDPSKF